MTKEYLLSQTLYGVDIITNIVRREYPDHITAFFSPLWHELTEADGSPLEGSMAECRIMSRKCDGIDNNALDNNKKIMKKVILTLAAVAMFAGMTSCTCCQKSEEACECENCTEQCDTCTCCQADTTAVEVVAE